MALLTAEIRYSSNPHNAETLAGLLGFGETKFVNAYNQTIYLESSGNTTNRGRRYAPSGLPGVARFKSSDQWTSEQKSSMAVGNGWRAVAKVQAKNTPFSFYKSPITAVSYRRRHFVESENENAIRVTVDSDIQFYKFDEPDVARRIGSDSATIVEIKTPPRLNSPVLRSVQRIVRDNSSGLAVSKLAKSLKFGYGER